MIDHVYGSVSTVKLIILDCYQSFIMYLNVSASVIYIWMTGIVSEKKFMACFLLHSWL